MNLATANHTGTGNGAPNGAANGATETMVVGQTSQGTEIRATLLRLTRHSAVFEVYNPGIVLRSSEVLTDFRITVEGRPVYAGRAVLGNLIDTGPILVCEAILEDSWFDIDFFAEDGWKQRLKDDFLRFQITSEQNFKVRPEFKVAVANLQVFLMDLRIWTEQVELGVRSQPTGDRVQAEREAILSIQEPVVKVALEILEQFESSARQVEPGVRDLHMNYMKRQIHPLVLCSPFIHRTYYKPLGYAGDYEMVNMMVRDPFEGGSIFAKIINHVFLSTPPVEAHRDRLVYLTKLLTGEALRLAPKKQPARFLNVGCGPAKEVQDFFAAHNTRQPLEFTVVDFNEETLAFAHKALEESRERHQRDAKIKPIRKSINQFIKEAFKLQNGAARYDVIYCAGLFDYLTDPVCKRLMNIFFDSLAPGGLVIATNVNDLNPSRNWMEYVLDWHLIYRDARSFAELAPGASHPDWMKVRAVGTGVNIFLEVRKPEDA